MKATVKATATNVRKIETIEEDFNGNPYRSMLIFGYPEDIRPVMKSLYRNGYKHGLYPSFLGIPEFRYNEIYGIEINTETGDYQVVTSTWIYSALISENII